MNQVYKVYKWNSHYIFVIDDYLHKSNKEIEPKTRYWSEKPNFHYFWQN